MVDFKVWFCFYVCVCCLVRRMRGGRRLWESKDDRKWGHDKFEEITLQERQYKEVMIDFCELIGTNFFNFLFCLLK